MRTSIVYSKCPEWFYIKNCSNKFNFRVLSIFLLACCSICRGCEAVGLAVFDGFPEKSGDFPFGKCATISWRQITRHSLMPKDSAIMCTITAIKIYMRNLAQAKIPEWIYIRNCANKLHLRVFSIQYYVMF